MYKYIYKYIYIYFIHVLNKSYMPIVNDRTNPLS